MKWVMAIIVIAFLLSTFLMYEGRSTRRSPSRNPDGTMSDYEVAQINGRSLMRSELEQRVRNYLQNNYNSRNLASLDMPAIYNNVLNQAILDSQLLKEVQEKGITVTDAEAEQVMKNYADTYFPTREAFYQVLAQNGIKIEDYKQNLARQIATERLVRQAVGEIIISEDQAAEFYDSMKSLIYTQPEGFMIQAAQFNTSSDAENFRSRLIKGDSWLAILSDDKFDSKDVINITKDPIFMPSTAFRTGTFTVLASLDINQPSPVFSVSSYDFAVALKTEHVDSSVRPYNEVSGDIKALLTQQEERKRLTDYETELRNKAQVVINDESLFARPVVSEDEPPKFDYDISVQEVSGDSTPESSEPESKPVETQTPAINESKSEDKPAISEPEIKSEDSKPVETPAPVEIKSENVKETPEINEPEAKPVETPAKTPEISESKPEDKPAISEPESKPEDSKPVETPAVNEPEAKLTESQAINESKSDDAKPAVTLELEQESPAPDSKPVETPAKNEPATEILPAEIKSESQDNALENGENKPIDAPVQVTETVITDIKADEKILESVNTAANEIISSDK